MQLSSKLVRLLPSPTPALFAGVLVLGLGAAACTDSPGLGETSQASTVANYAGSPGGCSTAVVIGLSAQIAQEAGCEDTNGFVEFDGVPNIELTSNSVLPYLLPDAATALQAEASSGHPLQVNSALRTIAQQYLLYQWYLEGGCGITAAATVGNSNHEGGRAVDLANWASYLQSMPAHGWMHDVPGDVVHFDHTASADDRGRDVMAFQHLWNMNNPDDQIAEDGDYGPMTAARLKASPSGGFPIGPSCTSATSHIATSTVASVDGPDQVQTGTRAHYTFTLRNTGTVDWSDATEIAIASGQASQLYDDQSWMSPTVVGVLPNAVPAGGEVAIDFDVLAPAVTAETPISEPMVLSDSGAQVAAFNFGVTVTMGSNTTTSDDTAEQTPPTVTGGCSTSGGGAGLLLALVVPAIVLGRRRRY